MYAELPAPSPAASPLTLEHERRNAPPGVIRAERLFRGGQEILIDHQGETYRLRITKNGKLILTK